MSNSDPNREVEVLRAKLDLLTAFYIGELEKLEAERDVYLEALEKISKTRFSKGQTELVGTLTASIMIAKDTLAKYPRPEPEGKESVCPA